MKPDFERSMAAEEMKMNRRKQGPWSACCTFNGCVFLREGLSRKAANLEATSHGQSKPGHAVSVVDMGQPSGNPGAGSKAPKA